MLRFVRGLRARALTETLISRGAIVAASGDAAGADDPGSAVRRHLSPAGRCAIAQLLHCQQSGQGDQDLAESLVPWRPQTQHWRSLHGSRAPQLAQNQLSPETEAPAVNPLQAIPQVQRSPEAVKTPSAGASQAPTAVAKLRNTKISPKKLNDFARIIRKMHVNEALLQCEASPKKASRLVLDVIMAARANAMNNNGLNGQKLYIDKAEVGKAKHLQRNSIHGRGRSGRKHKYRSNLMIQVREEAGAAIAKTNRTRIMLPLLQCGRGNRPQVSSESSVPYFG